MVPVSVTMIGMGDQMIGISTEVHTRGSRLELVETSGGPIFYKFRR